MSAIKNDIDKVPLELIPEEAMEEVARVLKFGKDKYGRDNWRRGMDWTRLIGASKRHIAAFNKGEDLDPESNLSHLAHAVCCLLFIIQYQTMGAGVDDRYKKEV